MQADRSSEQEFLHNAGDSLVAEGYDVVYEPTPELLPAFLKSLRPDAIAIGKTPPYVLAVATEGDEEARIRIRLLQAALNKEKGWKLKLIYNRSPTAHLTAHSALEILGRLQEVEAVEKVDSRAALLYGWACLEAIARAISLADFKKPQTPARIVEQLAAAGLISPQEAAVVRNMVGLRNALIHGDLSVRVSAAQVEAFIGILKQLVARRLSQPGTEED